MKEQDAAHSFEKEDDDIRGHHEPDDRPQSMIDLAEKIKLEEQLKLSELTRLRSELQQLKAWKESELKLWSPILEFMRTHPDRRLGESIPDRVLEFLKEHSRLKSELQQTEERLEGKTKSINQLYKSLQDRNNELQQEREKVKELTDELLELRKFDER